MIRNKRFKLYVETDRSSAKLVDLETDPAELKNRLTDPKLAGALRELKAIEKTLPAADASPRYSPLPDQPWDVKQKNPGRKTGLKGLPSNAPRKGRPGRKKRNHESALHVKMASECSTGTHCNSHLHLSPSAHGAFGGESTERHSGDGRRSGMG